MFSPSGPSQLSVEVSPDSDFDPGGVFLQDGVAVVAEGIATAGAEGEQIGGTGAARQGADEGGGFGGAVIEFHRPWLGIFTDTGGGL